MERNRQRLLDLALVAICLLLTAFAVKGNWSPLPWPVIALTGVVGSAAQLWRRQLPQVATVLGAVAYAMSGNPGPLLVGLYAAGAYGKRALVWLWALVGWSGFTAAAWIAISRFSTFDATWAALATVVVAGLGFYASTRRTLQESLRVRAEQAEAERSLREQQARSAERARIAREMHDVLAHKVSLIAVQAGAMEVAAGSERDRDGAALIRITAREALADLRTVLSVLHEEPAPFADVDALVAEATAAGQHAELADSAGPVPPETARTLYRVVQEGLTNARKHAPGAPVTVTIDRGPGDAVSVAVRNAAATTEPLDLPGAGAGLIGLAERLRLLDGSLKSGPAGDGWQLRAVIPLPVSGETA